MLNSQIDVARVVLVTGGTGFIGSNLVRKLSNEGWLVHVVSRQYYSAETQLPNNSPSVFYHQFDGTTVGLIKIVQDAKPEVVIHLASLFLSQHDSNDINALVESNLLFSMQLCEAMEKNGVRRLVNTGTSWQFYENIRENPVNLYSATKEAFEKILNYYINAHDFSVITLYLYDTYGPGDPRPKLVNLLFKAISSQKSIDMSPGEQRINLVYIADILQAYTIALGRLIAPSFSQSYHEKFSICSESSLSLKELVALVERVTSFSLAVNWGAREYRLREVMIPWEGCNTLSGWSPSVPLAEGISLTWNAIKSQLNGG